MIEYFSLHLTQFWLLVAFICLIAELTSGDFYILSFAIGASITCLFSFFTIPIYAQFGLFIFFSLLCIFLVRPKIVKILYTDTQPSNVDAMIGRKGVVTTAIPEGGYGRVKIDGDSWKAMTDNGEPMEEGTTVQVTRIDSLIITVKK